MTDRTHILDTAYNLITGPRQEEYGPPQENFQHIADRWSQLLGVKIDSWKVALMMADLKIARMATTGKPHEDSFVDICGYASIAAELAD